VYPKLYQECDYCGARISDGLYQTIVLQLADTEEEKVFYFCCRNCRRAFARRLTKSMGRVGFDLVFSKLGGPDA
jgi:ribosomal protein L24E